MILVEGKGEVAAITNIVTRISISLEHHIPWKSPRRFPNLHMWENRKGCVRHSVELYRNKPDVGALLVVVDADEKCPREIAPNFSQSLRDLVLPFPVAYVMMKPEYEVLFLPCIDLMIDLGYPADLVWDRDSWEAKRDVKGWLSNQLPPGRSYKPTVDQLRMTQRLDISRLQEANVSCFGSLERAVDFLCTRFGKTGVVYP